MEDYDRCTRKVHKTSNRCSLLGRFPTRYIFAVLGSIGMAIVYGLKVNLSVAIVAMVNHSHFAEVNSTQGVEGSLKQSESDDRLDYQSENDVDNEDGPFFWDERNQGLILSSYFWGYLVAQIPGGWIAQQISAKWAMFGSVAINIIGSILTPLFANIGYEALLIIRITQGIAGGVTFPAMHNMIACWSPPQERSTISAIIYAGTSLGTVLSIFLTGFLAANFGWEWVFYAMGLLSSIWCLLWVLLIEDSPSQQKYITQNERKFIMESLGSNQKNHKHYPMPWKQALTTTSVLVIMATHVCNNCGWYFLLLNLPTYMNQILHFSIKKNANLSALPYFCLWIYLMILSKILDESQIRGVLSTVAARKIATALASVLPAICLITLSLIETNATVAVVLLTLSIMFSGGMFVGFLASLIDIAPNFAGSLMSVSNTLATIPGIVVPIIVGQLTHQKQTATEWQIIFIGVATIYFIQFVVFTFFGSGQEAEWNQISRTDDYETQVRNKINVIKNV